MSRESRKSIFITGAAQGIGRATAEHFARQGWFVGLADRDGAALDALRAQLGDGNCHAQVLDVTDADAFAEALEHFWTAAGERLDVLLNNAGILASGAFEEIPLARHHAIVDVNLKGVINGAHRGYAYLSRTQGARLINLASASAIYGAADLASYSATKFAVRGLTEALDIEWQPRGVRVSAIWPIYTRTAMVEDMQSVSLKRLGARLTAQDVAQAIWNAATGPHQVHHRVGAQTHAVYWATCYLPDRWHRALTAWVSGR